MVRSVLSPMMATRAASLLQSKLPSIILNTTTSSSSYRVVLSLPSTTAAATTTATGRFSSTLALLSTNHSVRMAAAKPRMAVPMMASAAVLTTHNNYTTLCGRPSTMTGVSSLRPLSLLPVSQGWISPAVALSGSSSSTGVGLSSSSPLALSLGALSTFSSGRPSSGSGAPKGGGSRMGMGAGMITAGAVLLGKGKYILGALKLTKFASLASMFVTIGAYSMIFGLPYAVGMVGLILIHECGHAIVMNHYKIPFSPMVFMPFMGAVIAMKDQPKDAWQDAIIAFGGPVLGTVGAAGVAVGAQATDSQLLYALADFGFMVNLFNMMPLGSMDGGRITGALSPYAGIVGLGMGGSLIATGVIANPIIYLVMLAGGWSTFQRFYDPAGHQPSPNYYKITPTQRGILGGCYFGLIGVMVAGMAVNGVNKKPPEEIRRQYQELSFDDRAF